MTVLHEATTSARPLTVEVLRAWPDHVWRRQVHLEPGATVQQALQASGVFQAFPELTTQPPAIGIFGRLARHTDTLRDGDRVELYRSLRFDPKESRRRRAAHKLAQRASAAAPSAQQGPCPSS